MTDQKRLTSFYSGTSMVVQLKQAMRKQVVKIKKQIKSYNDAASKAKISTAMIHITKTY
jgi:uncharacterized protein YerC